MSWEASVWPLLALAFLARNLHVVPSYKADRRVPTHTSSRGFQRAWRQELGSGDGDYTGLNAFQRLASHLLVVPHFSCYLDYPLFAIDPHLQGMENCHSSVLSVEHSLQGSRDAISDLQYQVNELKQDKRDLRAHNESLMREIAGLKGDMKAAVERASCAEVELQKAKCEVEDWKVRYGLEIAKRPIQSHIPTSLQPEMSSPNRSTEVPTVLQRCLPASDPHIQRPNKKRKTSYSTEASGGKDRQALIATGKVVFLRMPFAYTGRLTFIQQPQAPRGPSGQDINLETPTDRRQEHRGRPVVPFNEDEAFVLPPQVLAQILSEAPALDISPAPSDLHVTRKFLADSYGGSPGRNAQHIAANQNPSGNRQRGFVFPDFDFNPAMPLVPGHSGVILASRYNRKSEHPWSLFRKGLTGGSPTWLYMARIRRRVKDHFADQIVNWKRGTGEPYGITRARIALGKAGFLTTGDKEVERTLIREEIERAGSNTRLPIDRSDVIAAFERGDESVDITLVRCVSYDWTLAMDIEAKFCLMRGRLQGSLPPGPRISLKRKRPVVSQQPVLQVSSSMERQSPNHPEQALSEGSNPEASSSNQFPRSDASNPPPSIDNTICPVFGDGSIDDDFPFDEDESFELEYPEA
ncbi:hypothetical protein NMY22_g1800 [Coprinellus aureogranulatus]|nr:hypothetical protein NMY22_g1800 [Coprinellus aureogranulatus]